VLPVIFPKFLPRFKKHAACYLAVTKQGHPHGAGGDGVELRFINDTSTPFIVTWQAGADKEGSDISAFGPQPEIVDAHGSLVLGKRTMADGGLPFFYEIRLIGLTECDTREQILLFKSPNKMPVWKKVYRFDPVLKKQALSFAPLGIKETEGYLRETGREARDLFDYMEALVDEVLLLEYRFNMHTRLEKVWPPHEPVSLSLIGRSEAKKEQAVFLTFRLAGYDHASTVGFAVACDQDEGSTARYIEPARVRNDLEKAISYLYAVYGGAASVTCRHCPRCGRDFHAEPAMPGGFDPDDQAFYAWRCSLILHDRPCRDMIVFVDPVTVRLLFAHDALLASGADQPVGTWIDYFYMYRRRHQRNFYTRSAPPRIDIGASIHRLPDFNTMNHPNTFREGQFRTWTDYGQRILWFFEDRLNKGSYCPITHHFLAKENCELYVLPTGAWPELYPDETGISPYGAHCFEAHWDRRIPIEWHFPYGVRGNDDIWVVWPGKKTLFCLRITPLPTEDRGCFPTRLKEVTPEDVMFRRAAQSLMAFVHRELLSGLGDIGLGQYRIIRSSRGFMPRYAGVHLIHPKPDRFELVWAEPRSNAQKAIPMDRAFILEWYWRQPKEVRAMGDILPPMPIGKCR